MVTIEEVKQIIQTNQDDIAFIVGNGIHRYENKGALAWDKLLIELWNTTQKNKISNIHTGTTYTEFYDILEMNCERMAKAQIQKSEIRLLAFEKINYSLDPTIALQNGFVLIEQAGLRIKRKNQLNLSEGIGILFQDGKVEITK